MAVPKRSTVYGCRPGACGGAYSGCVAQPVQAFAAIPLEARRFEDLGALAAVRLETRRFEDLGRYQFEAMIERVRAAEQQAAELLDGRTVWMVNSTAVGGGVSQLLRTLLPYWRGAGIDVRWMVLRGSAEFFRVTKRFHNHLQGQPGDGGVLGVDELTTLDQAAHQHAAVLASQLARGDVVVLNDPQTAGMSVPLARAGANVIWCCHVGIDRDNEFSRNAWKCLRPRLAGAQRFVFSRYTSLPEWLGGAETSILTPGIDPASTKNLPMSEDAARAILQHLGRHQDKGCNGGRGARIAQCVGARSCRPRPSDGPVEPPAPSRRSLTAHAKTASASRSSRSTWIDTTT
jgi:hypothetical protein